MKHNHETVISLRPLLAALIVIASLARAEARAQIPAPAHEPAAQVARALLPMFLDATERSRAADRQEREREAARAEEERTRAQEDRERARRERALGQEEQHYERGVRALDERQWERAIEAFGEVLTFNGSRADGGSYWKAYAQHKLGQRAEALQTLAALRQSFPESRWLSEARALEVEIRQASGQAVRPENESDEELKLLALNAAIGMDPERALPLLEKLLQGSQSPKLKERALFVLAQSSHPRARDVLASVAKGEANPDLQAKAIHYLGVHGGQQNRALLAEIYASSSDVGVKRAILRSFMVSGDRAQLLRAAKSETVSELRGEAIRQLGTMHAHQELTELYQSETSTDNRRHILQAMFVAGHADKLIELARTEKDPGLRRRAVHNLGLMGSTRTGEALASIYNTDKDPEIRREVIQALFVQNNARTLVDLARKEKDPAMLREMIRKLSLMKSKEAADFLLELLNR